MDGWMERQLRKKQVYRQTGQQRDRRILQTDRQAGRPLYSQGGGQTILTARMVAYSLKWLSASEK